MVFFYRQGPPLQVVFHVQRGMLVKTELFSDLLNTNKETRWEIVSDRSSPRLEDEIVVWMDDYCSGKQPHVSLPVAIDLFPPFTRAVLTELLATPFGRSVTYQEMASLVGNAKASRAVGNACARNPLPLVIPCHRVLAQGNRLGGFSCGLPIKNILLQHEGIDNE